VSDRDREFWLLVRRALLMICQAIERRFIDAPPVPCHSMGEWKDT